MKTICLITENSRSINYGIGTYINQLISAIKKDVFKIIVFCLYDLEHQNFFIEDRDGCRYIYIPKPHINSYQEAGEWRKTYFRAVFYMLFPYLNLEERLIFHFNFFDGYQLVSLLKKRCPNAKFVLTVHYMGWSFDLLGNVERLRNILKNPNAVEYKSIVESIAMEKGFMTECCDSVIAVADHSYQTLVKEYSIPLEKLKIIKHGIIDRGLFCDEELKMKLRKKYDLNENDFILVYAGRLDPVKGISVLLKAFKDLNRSYDTLKLLVIGDGDIKRYLEEANGFWSKIIFTGFVNKPELYELYALSDVGVLPSLHEEFGFVAIEMQMQALPLVVSDTTGLKEIVDEEVGIKVTISDDENLDLSADNLKKAIQYMLCYPSERHMMGNKARTKFLREYESSIFENKMMDFYNDILE